MSPTSFLGQIASATGNPATDSANLVTALNILFTHDQMPTAMHVGDCSQCCSFTGYRPARPRIHLAGHQFQLLPDRTLEALPGGTRL